jgi:hypothetical protein
MFKHQPLLFYFLRYRGYSLKGGIPPLAPTEERTSLLSLFDQHNQKRLTNKEQQQMDRCFVYYQAQHLWLHNASQSLVCAVNGKKINPFEQYPVTLGDTVQIGLFECELIDMDQFTKLLDLEKNPLSVSHQDDALTNQTPQHILDSSFRLSDLLLLEKNTPQLNPTWSTDQPILLTKASANIALDQITQTSQDVLPSHQELDKKVIHISELDEQLSSLVAHEEELKPIKENLSTSALQQQKTEQQLFADLHDDYLTILTDPSAITSKTDWINPIKTEEKQSQGDIMEYLASTANREFDNIFEVVGNKEQDTQLLSNLHDGLYFEILQPEETPSIVRLFAPGEQNQTSSSHASEKKLLNQLLGKDTSDFLEDKNLPSITQKEHHQVGLDSVIPFSDRHRPTPTTQQKDES